MRVYRENQESQGNQGNQSHPATQEVQEDSFSEDSLLFLVDCHEKSRLENRTALWERWGSPWIIDHHEYQISGGGQEWIDPGRSSSAEMIAIFGWELEKLLQKPLLDKDSATDLVTGIYTDTGALRYSNATATTFETVARLMSYPVPLTDINERLFYQISFQKLKARACVFEKAVREAGGRLIWAYMTPEEKTCCGATDDELGTLCAEMKSVAGVSASFFFTLRGTEDNPCLHVSIRSDETFDAALFAQTYGGGGHRKAAGCQIPLRQSLPEEAIRSLLDQAKIQLSRQK